MIFTPVKGLLGYLSASNKDKYALQILRQHGCTPHNVAALGDCVLDSKRIALEALQEKYYREAPLDDLCAVIKLLPAQEQNTYACEILNARVHWLKSGAYKKQLLYEDDLLKDSFAQLFGLLSADQQEAYVETVLGDTFIKQFGKFYAKRLYLQVDENLRKKIIMRSIEAAPDPDDFAAFMTSSLFESTHAASNGGIKYPQREEFTVLY